jgi:hypothetical protein
MTPIGSGHKDKHNGSGDGKEKRSNQEHTKQVLFVHGA